MCNQPDESLIEQCEHNMGSSWYHCYDIERLILTNLPYSHKVYIQGFLYLNSSTVHVVLNCYWEHTLLKVTDKVKLVQETGLVCDYL